MKKIKTFMLAVMAMALTAPLFTACGSDDDKTVENIVSEFSVNDQKVAAQKKASGKNVAVLLIAFGSTWNNAFSLYRRPLIRTWRSSWPGNRTKSNHS